MTQFAQFARRIGLIGATNLIISLQGLILLPIFTKTLPIEEYGTWIQIMVTIGLIPALVMLGLPYTMVRYLAAAKNREDIQEGFYSITFITVFSAGIVSFFLVLFAEPISAVLFDNSIEITRFLGLLVFLECMNLLQYNYFRTFQQIKRYSFLLLFRAFLQIALAGGLVLSGYGIYGAVLGYLIASALLLLVMAILIVSEIGVVIPKFMYLREYLSFGLPTVPTNISSWIVNSSDRYLIGILLGIAFVGYYSPGYTLGNIVNMYIAPLSFLLPAILSKYYDEGDLVGVGTIIQYSLKYYLLLAIPSVIGLSFLSKPILEILSTNEIAQEGYLITPFVALSALIFGIYAIVMNAMILEKKTKIIGIIWILAAIVNFGLNLIFIPLFGILGAAFTTLLSFMIALVGTVHYSKEFLSLSFSMNTAGSILRILLASICMIPVLFFLNPHDLLSIGLSIGICAVIFFAVLFLVRGISKEEIEFFKGCISDYNK